MFFLKKVLEIPVLVLLILFINKQICTAAAADVAIPAVMAQEINTANVSVLAQEAARAEARRLIMDGFELAEILQHIQNFLTQCWEQEQNGAPLLPLPNAPLPVAVLPVVPQPNLYNIIDNVDWRFMSDPEKAVEHAWLDEQLGAERPYAEIAAAQQERIANSTIRHLQSPTIFAVPAAADHAAWCAANIVPDDTTCSICQESLAEIATRDANEDHHILRLSHCNHFICKTCCKEDFASYENRTVDNALDPAMMAMKTEVEQGRVDIMTFPEEIRVALLEGVMRTPAPVQKLFETRQYQCPMCRTIGGMIDEE